MLILMIILSFLSYINNQARIRPFFANVDFQPIREALVPQMVPSCLFFPSKNRLKNFLSRFFCDGNGHREKPCGTKGFANRSKYCVSKKAAMPLAKFSSVSIQTAPPKSRSWRCRGSPCLGSAHTAKACFSPLWPTPTRRGNTRRPAPFSPAPARPPAYSPP